MPLSTPACLNHERRVHKAVIAMLLVYLISDTPTLAADPFVGMSPEVRQIAQDACVLTRIQGPATYRACLRDQARTFAGRQIPDLAAFAPEASRIMRDACVLERSKGPAAYSVCLERQAAAYRHGPGLPETRGVPREDVASAKMACTLKRLAGADAYARCLRRMLRQVGYEELPTRGRDNVKAVPGDAPRVRNPGCPSGTVEDMSRGTCVPRDPQDALEFLRQKDRSKGLDISGEPTTELEPEKLAQLQDYLATLGYYDGAVDGLLGAKTLRAVKAFQADIGRQPTGHADANLLDKVKKWVVLQDLYRVETANERAPMPDPKFGPKLSPADLYSKLAPSVYLIMARRGLSDAQGSAVAISTTQALTNCHVLEETIHAVDVVKGNLPDIILRHGEKRLTARMGYYDAISDACFLEVPDGGLQPVPGVRLFADLDIGETVYSIGSPAGLENTLAEGLISGRRKVDGVKLVQTSAPVSPGSSGGGLFDRKGNLVGITVGYLQGGQNLNFAIAVDAFWTDPLATR